jgi:multiple sugar transport system permease protein
MLVYVLMLFSVVGGTAAMVLIFLANSLGLIDTHIGVILVMTGGFSAAIFMMRDLSIIPRSYEEAALVCGASRCASSAILLSAGPSGVAVIAIWTFERVGRFPDSWLCWQRG